jgi:TolA-binding protein
LQPQALYWLAEAAFRLGRLEDAQRRLDEMAGRGDGNDLPWLPLVQLRRAQILARQKDWDAALVHAVELAERFPDFDRQYEVDYLIGRCLASEGSFSDARQAYERVIHNERGRHTETAAMAQWMIGETYFHQKNYDEAVRAYARVGILWDYPRWTAAALLQMGKCYETQQQWREAAAQYTELALKYPDTTFAQEGQRRLSLVRQRAATAPPAVPQTSSRQDRPKN